MIVDRHSASWLVFVPIGVAMIETLYVLEITPKWLIDLLFVLCWVLVAGSVLMFGVSILNRHLMTTGQSASIFGLRVGGWLPLILNYEFKILSMLTSLVLIVVILIPLSLLISPSEPESIDNHRNTAISPVEVDGTVSPLSDRTNVVIPLTPTRLFEIARTQTTRDAMSYKGTVINLQGTVLNISEVGERWFEADALRKSVIGIDVAIGSLPHDRGSDKVHMFVEADRWKPQVDKIKRGDRIVASGVVDHVSISLIGLINGEIISVSRPDGNRR